MDSENFDCLFCKKSTYDVGYVQNLVFACPRCANMLKASSVPFIYLGRDEKANHLLIVPHYGCLNCGIVAGYPVIIMQKCVDGNTARKMFAVAYHNDKLGN